MTPASRSSQLVLSPLLLPPVPSPCNWSDLCKKQICWTWGHTPSPVASRLSSLCFGTQPPALSLWCSLLPCPGRPFNMHPLPLSSKSSSSLRSQLGHFLSCPSPRPHRIRWLLCLLKPRSVIISWCDHLFCLFLLLDLESTRRAGTVASSVSATSPAWAQGSCWGRGCSLSEGGRPPVFTFAEEPLNGLGACATHLRWGVSHGRGIQAQGLQTQGGPSLWVSFTSPLIASYSSVCLLSPLPGGESFPVLIRLCSRT